MPNPKVGVVLGVLGVVIVLLPILLLFVTGGLESPIQRLYDTQLMPGLPMGVIITAVGGVVSVVGLVLFVRGMRAPPDYTHTPSVPRRPYGMSTASNDLRSVEKELEEILEEEKPVIEVRTVQPRSQQQPQPQPKQTPPTQPQASNRMITVVTQGVDEVCKTCGALNVLGAKMCSQCGGELYKPDPKALPCPVCGAPLDETMKVGDNIVCTVCFSELRVAQV
ncbi:MAG: zinc ribbon domain-containing protein [Candidatus Caldarchaeum sp.]|nr:zinc ribbon domain-containing protein [Candidatus Caldarchaeum sp.]